MHIRTRTVVLTSLAIASIASFAGLVRADIADPFPISRPADRLQAFAALGRGVHAPSSCVTLRIEAILADPDLARPTARRAIDSLRQGAPLPAEQRVEALDGHAIRFTLDPSSLDRLHATDVVDGDLPGVAAARSALVEAHTALVEQLDLPDPGPLEVVLAHLGPGDGGAFLPAGTSGGTGIIWVDGPGSEPERIRSAILHHYSHAVATRLRAGPAWGEALAGWAILRAGALDASRVEDAVSARLARLTAGIPTEDAMLALGNSVWLAWLEEAKGAIALRIALEELSAGGHFEDAMDRALKRVDGSGFEEGLRDFHLWAVLVGSRDDGRHFPFASRLADPVFHDQSNGLPALSIQAAPVISSGGAAHALVRPDGVEGGVSIRFEGEFGGSWNCDLLLHGPSGSLHRLAVPLNAEGRGEVTVPAEAAEEITILVRNLGDRDGAPRRYTWTAFREPGYPVEFASLSASPMALQPGAVSVRWETSSEIGLVGFHVLRATTGGGEFRHLHSVWVPSVGTPGEGALYEFIDREARPGVPYLYRVDAVTEHGLVSRSNPVSLAIPFASAR